MDVLEMYKQKNHFMTHNFIEPVKCKEDESELKVELQEAGKNMSGYAHGGLFMTLSDCAAGLAARSDGRRYVTQNLNINFISNITDGIICARGKVISRGRTIVVVKVEIRNEKNRLLADATASMFCVDK